jgi:hypothetical protein
MKNKWEKNYPNISKEVEAKGIKLLYLASSAGLTYRQLYGRLTNEIEFELPVMRKISKVLGKTMDHLFNDKNF